MGRFADLCGEVAAALEEDATGSNLTLPPEAWDRFRTDWSEEDIEDAMGHVKYALFYFICGIAAAYAMAYMDPGSPIPMVGASGAIVFIEPSPYELSTLGASLIFFATGLRMRLVFVPLLLALFLLNVGYTIGAIPFLDKSEVANWIATSWYMAVTVIFFFTHLIVMVFYVGTRIRPTS